MIKKKGGGGRLYFPDGGRSRSFGGKFGVAYTLPVSSVVDDDIEGQNVCRHSM